jgi:AraC-like DNA-binding protein
MRHGALELARNGSQCCANEKQVVAIPGGMAFDLTCRTNRDGHYVADLLIPDPAIEWRAATSEGMVAAQCLPRPIDVSDPRFRQSLDRAMAAINQQQELPDVIAVHHMREVFQWIELKGGYAHAPCDGSISGRIWSICASDPSRDWRPDEVAHRMGLPVSGLRSKIHDEGRSFSQLLHDMRMAHALSLLLTTNLPIYAIGREIGYQSAPRFSIRFNERYGLRPGDVRGHDRPVRSRHLAPSMSSVPAFAHHA